MLLFVLLLNTITSIAVTSFEHEDFGGNAHVLGNVSFVSQLFKGRASVIGDMFYTAYFGGDAYVEGDIFTSQDFGGRANVRGWSNPSDYWKFTISSNFTSPKNVHATRYNRTCIRLTWDNCTLSQRTIIRASKIDFPKINEGTLLYNGTLEIFNHTSLPYGTTYYYSLYTYSNIYGMTGNTTASNSTEPNIPTNVICTGSFSTKIGLTWTKGTNATHTVIYTHNGTDNTLRYNGIVNSTIIINLTASKTYNFRLYSYNSSNDVMSTRYAEFNASTSYSNTPPTNFKATSYNDTRIYLSWTKGNGTKTVIKRSFVSFPNNYSGGTIVYSSTGSSCYDTGLNASTMYYYRAWSVTGTSYSDLNAMANNYTRPQVPLNGSSVYNTTSFTAHFKWMNGNGTTHMQVVRKTTGYPSSETDGTNVSFRTKNTTWNYYNKSVITTNYFTVYSYNSTTGFFSRTGLDIPWGCVGVNCYNESNPSQALKFNLEITNQPGTMVYKRNNINNTHFIDAVNDMPTGNNVIFIVESTGYKQRIYYKNIALNNFYNFSFYLPPITTPGDNGGGGGGGDTSDCMLRTFTNSIFISNPGVDANITFTYELEDMIDVQIYNETLYGTYGGWMFVTENNYTYNSTMVSIDEDVLDKNITMAKASYYYWYCPNETIETPLYYLRVVETIQTEYADTDRGVANAIINIKRYINTSGIYLNVSTLLTDANGYVNLYLIPGTLYKINITKDGYYNSLSDYIPAKPNQYGQTDLKIFMIIRENITPIIPTIETVYTNITWTVEPKGLRHTNIFTFYYNISSSDNKLEWFSLQVYFFNTSQGIWVLIYNANVSNSSGGNLSYTIPNIHGRYDFVCLYKKIGFDTYAISQTGGFLHFLVELKEAVQTIPDYAWFIITIVLMIVGMGFFIYYFGSNIIVGYLGLGIFAMMLLIKDFEIPISGVDPYTGVVVKVGGWVILGITFLIYTMVVFLYSRL